MPVHVNELEKVGSIVGSPECPTGHGCPLLGGQ